MAGSLFAGLQHLDSRFIDLKVSAGAGLGGQPVVENLQAIHRLGSPPVQCRLGNGDVFAQKPLALTVQRQVVDVLVYQNSSQQARPGNPFVDGPLGELANVNAIAGLILRCVFIADIPLDVEAGRGQFQLFGYLFSDTNHSLQITIGENLNLFNRQMIRQGEPSVMVGFGRGVAHIGDFLFMAGLLVVVLLGAGLEWQASLVGVTFKTLALLAEEHPLKLGNNLIFFRQAMLQFGDLLQARLRRLLLSGQALNQLRFGKDIQVR